jgi:hypothetical protein
MTDALQAYRLIAQQGILPADYKVSADGDMQGWLDRYFTQANRLPDLSGAGFKPVSGRLLSTEQGPAAMVIYEDQGGHKVSFYVRPPGPKNFLLPRGSRRDDGLQAEYWSGAATTMRWSARRIRRRRRCSNRQLSSERHINSVDAGLAASAGFRLRFFSVAHVDLSVAVDHLTAPKKCIHAQLN